MTIFFGILNVTPDSFSDGGKFLSEAEIEKQIISLKNQNFDVIDIGGESTRPLAQEVETEVEIKRISNAIQIAKTYFSKISIDTRKPEVAKVALKLGANILNDVSGFENKEMLAIAKDFKQIVCMHSLSIPPQKDLTLTITEEDLISFFQNWIQNKTQIFQDYNINISNIFFDIGVGFGKTPNQTKFLLQNLEYIKPYKQTKLFIGHSKKSFLSSLFPNNSREEATKIVTSQITNKADAIRLHER